MIAEMPLPLLRRAGAFDAKAITDVTFAAYQKWIPIIGREPAPMLTDYDQAVRTHLIDVLEQAGRIIAVIELVPEPDCLLIENIAVLPAHAGQGHGKCLMAHAGRVARAYGLSLIRLYTNQKMTSNIAVYQHLGFTINCGAVTDDGRSIVYMSKPVTAEI
jgi:GNAT superfamily N-acetyltransferase